jgi:transcriptional regulator with XRE-family HTH domain
MPTIKERRKALGLSRAQLSAYAYVDPRTTQLIELGHQGDAACEDRLDRTLAALENGEQPPDWKDEVDAAIAAEQGTSRLMADPDAAGTDA